MVLLKGMAPNMFAVSGIVAAKGQAMNITGMATFAICAEGLLEQGQQSSYELRPPSSYAVKLCSQPHGDNASMACISNDMSFDIEPVRFSGIQIGKKCYASFDDFVRWGELLRQIFTPFVDFPLKYDASIIGVAALFCGAFSFPTTLFIGEVLPANMRSQFPPLQSMALITLFSFGPLMTVWTLGKISRVLQEWFQKKPSKTGIALWLRLLEEKGKAYVKDTDLEIENFRAELGRSARVVDSTTRRTYNYVTLLGPRSLSAIIKMASRYPRGVHLLREIGRYNDKLDDVVKELEIDWETCSAQDVQAEARWLACRGNRSVLFWLARRAANSASFIDTLRTLESVAGIDEIVSNIEVRWNSDELLTLALEERVNWMLSHGNRSVIQWLVDWALGGESRAERLLNRMEIFDSPSVRVLSAPSNFRVWMPVDSTEDAVNAEAVGLQAEDTSDILDGVKRLG